MPISTAVILENERAQLVPLQTQDFEKLYTVASDPEVWAHHPNKNRYERAVFHNFFEGALESKGAFLIVDKTTGDVAGSTRFYDFNEQEKSIFIGYTFLGTAYWGTGLNATVKRIMLDYVFQFVDIVRFHVGKYNLRSRKAMEKLGATLVGEIEVAYHGEPMRENVEYVIKKEDWVR